MTPTPSAVFTAIFYYSCSVPVLVLVLVLVLVPVLFCSVLFKFCCVLVVFLLCSSCVLVLVLLQNTARLVLSCTLLNKHGSMYYIFIYF